MSNLENRFGAWLRVVLPNSGISERDQRITIIQTLVATASKEDILPLVLAFYSAATSEPIVERIRTAMHGIDTSFGPKDDAELAVLAAGVLFEIFERGGDLGTAAALAILCADFGALADTDHITELIAKARQFVLAEGIRIREESVEIPSLRETLQSALNPQEEIGDARTADIEEGASNGEVSLRRVVDVVANYSEKLRKSVASIEARRAEQSDILYWLLSGRRHISDVPLKQLKVEEAAIFLAVELAKLTRQIPGPSSVSSILSTLFDQCKEPSAGEVTLEACIRSINALDGAEYLAKQEFVDPVISPISFALVKAEETGWEDGWQSAVKTQTRKSATTTYPVLKIAEQLYCEALLLRALEGS